MSSARRMRWLAHWPTHRRPVAKTLVHRRDMSMFDERCMKRVTAGATVGAAVGGAVGALTQVSTHTHLCSHRATSPAPLLRSLHRRGVWHIRGVSLQGARPVESAVHREDHYQQRRRVRPLPRSGQSVAMRTEKMTSRCAGRVRALLLSVHVVQPRRPSEFAVGEQYESKQRKTIEQ